MKPDEVRSLPPAYLRLIVLIEARAIPRLRNVDGLWRKPVKGRGGAQPRPGDMTSFIRDEHLLPAEEIASIIANAPADLILFQEAAAHVVLGDRLPMASWLERFSSALVDRLAA